MLPTTDRKRLILKKFGNSEGVFTKIITDDNRNEYEDLFQNLDEDEIPLIVCRFNHLHWTLLTKTRVLTKNEEGLNIIPTVEINYVNIDIPNEWANGAKTLAHFTKIILKDINNKIYVLTLEKGVPLGGFLNALNFIAGQ